MKRRLPYLGSLACLGFVVCLAATTRLAAQCGEGRIFNPTADTVGLWEFNGLGMEGEAVANGAVIPDLSGNGLHATVEANTDSIQVVPGNPDFSFPNDDPPIVNGAVGRASSSQRAARVVVNNDGGAFEMAEDESFSLELFIHREEVIGGETWGVLAGTIHSRALIDDGLDPITDGAWYGYGFWIDGSGTWRFTMCPVNPDGTLQTLSYNEQGTGTFVIEEGFHYLVAVIDRELGLANIYLDGQNVASRTVNPDWAFITPEGYDHGRLMFLNGEDDVSRNQYRPPPSGYQIDAARFQRTALTEEDVLDNWLGIEDAVAVPEGNEEDVQPLMTVSSGRVVVGQCVRLNGAASCARSGEIVQYEWRVGDGEFEVGEASRELSFDAPTGPEGGVLVTLRVTTDGGESGEAAARIIVEAPAPEVVVNASFAGLEAAIGDQLFVPQGTTLQLDASESATPIADTAVLCPIDDNVLVPLPENVEYRWDLDGDGTADQTGASIEIGPLNDVGSSIIAVAVVNDLGGETIKSFQLDVTSSGRSSDRVFHTTDDTIVHLEFNSFEQDLDEEIPDGTVIPDLSGNGFDAAIESNDLSGTLVAGVGDPVFNDPPRDPDPDRLNTSLRRANGAGAPVAVINNDDDSFELTEFDDLTIELYIRRDEVEGGQSWGNLAGTLHSRTLIDDTLDPVADGAWYGYGYWRDDVGLWRFTMCPVNPDGSLQTLSFNEQTTGTFVIPAGSHYLVTTIDRIQQETLVYLDGQQVARRALEPDWAFLTPPDYEKARFAFLTGVWDLSRGHYAPAPAGYAIDAARIQSIALSADEIAQNWDDIGSGAGANAPPPVEVQFKRGDVDANGLVDLTDPINSLSFQFLGQFDPPCMDALDFDDNGRIEVTDPVANLARQFLGSSPAPPPGSDVCGDDPTADDLDCAMYGGCQ